MMKKIITWFIDNPVISNLLMILIFLAGFITISNIKMEVFPGLELDVVTISVVYPGAAPEDVEKSVCIPIEESIFGISGIKNINSTASESYGVVVAQIISGEDTDTVKDKIKTKVESLKKGSIIAVSWSGINIISDSLIAFQPAIDEPSNIFPLVNRDSSTALAGRVTCCSLPLGSVNRKSTNLTSFSFIVFIISDIVRSYFYYICFKVMHILCQVVVRHKNMVKIVLN